MSSVFFKVFLVCHFFQFHHLKSALSCAQYPHSLLFHLILLKNIILSALQNLPAAALDKLAAFPKTKCSLSSIKGVLIDESNRNCQTDRRPRARRYPEGDTPHNADTGGRPDADNIDTRCQICSCFDGFIQENRTGVKKNCILATLRADQPICPALGDCTDPIEASLWIGCNIFVNYSTDILTREDSDIILTHYYMLRRQCYGADTKGSDRRYCKALWNMWQTPRRVILTSLNRLASGYVSSEKTK